MFRAHFAQIKTNLLAPLGLRHKCREIVINQIFIVLLLLFFRSKRNTAWKKMKKESQWGRKNQK